jgi:hypothetical protein
MFSTSATVASEPVPKESLLTPPADATPYIIVPDTNTYCDEWRAAAGFTGMPR